MKRKTLIIGGVSLLLIAGVALWYFKFRKSAVTKTVKDDIATIAANSQGKTNRQIAQEYANSLNKITATYQYPNVISGADKTLISELENKITALGVNFTRGATRYDPITIA